MISILNAYLYQKSLKYDISNGVFRTSAALEVDFFVVIIYSFKPLTVSIENSVLEDLRVLDPPLITSALLMMSNKLIFCRVFKYKSGDVIDLQLPESRS